MMIGTAISLIGVGLFAVAATHPSTGYHTFAVYFILMAVGGGVAYVAWMSGFTETVEKHNPAATATGLAVWGWIIRIIVTASYALLTAVVPATSTLVDQGPRVQSIVAKYPAFVKVDPATLNTLGKNPADQAAQVKALSELSGVPPADVLRAIKLSTADKPQLATAAAIDPATRTTLALNPTDKAAAAKAIGEIATTFHVGVAAATQQLIALGKVPKADLAFLAATGPKVQAAGTQLKALGSVPAADKAFLAANGAKVAKAKADNPGQWQTWWWICFAAQVLFLPFVFLLCGHWSPRRAREQEREHEAMVERELAALQASRA
jgi:flagellar basal body-associated protein FliL